MVKQKATGRGVLVESGDSDTVVNPRSALVQAGLVDNFFVLV